MNNNNNNNNISSNGTILVTGGAGYIGSHCCIELLNNNFDIIIVDNCINSIILPEKSLPECLIRIELLTGKKIKKFFKFNLNNSKNIDYIFKNYKIDAVIHFAALKSVNESFQIPLIYYQNNLSGTITLLNIMNKYNCKKLIFSSSATVYGRAKYLPIDEMHKTGEQCTNPYGRTKYFIEEILKDLCHSDCQWTIISLRYFNPIGAHYSGEIGEDPSDVPNNLMPFITQVAVRRRSYLNIYGNDFNTPDGTGVRDYIHIMDLANGHLLSLINLLNNDNKCKGWNVYNFGAGKGYSVLNVINAFEQSTGIKIPYKFCNRRNGDIDELWADITLVQNLLQWKPKWTLMDMCLHSWQWQSKYPMGYRTLSSASMPVIKILKQPKLLPLTCNDEKNQNVEFEEDCDNDVVQYKDDNNNVKQKMMMMKKNFLDIKPIINNKIISIDIDNNDNGNSNDDNNLFY